jgi:hypothetical protein
MKMSNATWAFGTQLEKDGVGIAEITNINGVEMDSDEIDVTNHDSADYFEEVMQSIRRTGVVSIEGNFIPGDAGQAALLTDYLAGTVGDYTIVFPVVMACEWSFKAFVKKPPSTSAPIDDKVPFSAELRITGKPSLDLSYTPNLTNLVVTTGALAPTFAGATREYTATIAVGQTTATITPTGATSGVIEVDGVVVASGQASGSITLGEAGTSKRVIVKCKATNSIAIEYVVYLHRLAA